MPLGKISPQPMQVTRRNRCQTRTRPRKKACVYGARVSGATIYSYVEGNPLSFTDPLGLARQGGKTGQWWQYTDRNFQRWFHQCVKAPGDPDATRADLADAYAQWVQSGKPDGKNGCGGPPPPPAPAETCGDACQKTATVVVVGGTAYVVYRCLRMLPSLLPPLWPTIPANVVVP